VRLLATLISLAALGSLGGLLIASSLLLARERTRARLIPWLLSYAVGTLLAVALLGLLPQALEEMASSVVLGTLLGGILTFFMLEKLVLWRHSHAEVGVHETTGTGAAPLVLLGGAVHNLADGAVIGAAAVMSVPLGLSAALAVAAHQIPQEVSDYAILLSAGYSRARAFLFNFLTALPSLLGASAMFLAAGRLPGILPFVLAFAAGSFLYVAMSDLIPNLHRGAVDASALRQILLIAAGIITILAL
jgi:zinc and cadmium transporter